MGWSNRYMPINIKFKSFIMMLPVFHKTLYIENVNVNTDFRPWVDKYSTGHFNGLHLDADYTSSEIQKFDFLGEFSNVRKFGISRFNKYDLVSLQNNLPESLEKIELSGPRHYDFQKKQFELSDFSFVDNLKNLKSLHLGVFNKNSNLRLSNPHHELYDLGLGAYNYKKIQIEASNYPNVKILGLTFDHSEKIYDFTANPNLKGLVLLSKSKDSDLNFLSTLPSNIEYIWLQGYPNAEKIPDVSNLKNLRYLVLTDVRGLKDLSSLVDLPKLEAFNMVTKNRDFNFESVRLLSEIPQLKHISVVRNRQIQDFETMEKMFGNKFHKYLFEYCFDENFEGTLIDDWNKSLSHIEI